jgi:hypothetical protein
MGVAHAGTVVRTDKGEWQRVPLPATGRAELCPAIEFADEIDG